MTEYQLRPGPKYTPGKPIHIEACFLDIDNTLVSNDGAELPSQHFQQLAHKAGNKTLISVVTARSLQRAEHIITAIGSKGISILSNGAVLYDAAKRKIIIDNSLPLDVTRELIQDFRQRRVSYEVQDDGIDYTWTYSKGSSSEDIVYTTAIDPLYPRGPRRIVPDYTPSNPRILCATVFSKGDVERINRLVSKFANREVTSFIGHTTLLNEGKTKYEVFIVHKHANKKWALTKTLELLGIQSERVMTVVDGHNDLVLLEMAGIGVAVENAVPEVVSNATFIAPSRQDDGAASALEELVINQRNGSKLSQNPVKQKRDKNVS